MNTLEFKEVTSLLLLIPFALIVITGLIFVLAAIRWARQQALEQRLCNREPDDGSPARRSNGRQQMVAVNADRRESNLSPIDKETLELWQNTGTGSESNPLAKLGEADTKPWSFWWYILFVLFLVSLTESLVGSRFIERDEPEEIVNRKEAA